MEGGLFVHYTTPEGTPVLQYRCVRLALAYDASTTRFERFGPPEELMHWVAERQAQLRGEGRVEEARNLTVALLPTDLQLRTLNQVEDDPSRFIYFLQKVGLV